MSRDALPSNPTHHPSDDRHGHFSAVLTGDSTDVRAARRTVAELAVANGFADRVADLTLAFDELVANAQEHGRPPITVETWYDGRVVLQVTDTGAGFDQQRIPSRVPSLQSHGGRGLWIIRQMADHVTVCSGGSGTTVRVELTHEPQIGA